MSESNQNNLPVYSGMGEYEEEQSLQLADLWALVWDHKWWYVICILAALLAAGFYLYKTPKTYSRTEKVIVDEDSQNSMMRDLTSFAGTARRYTSGTNVDNEIEAFGAPDLMQGVVTRLGLETSYIDNQFLRVREMYKNSPIEMRVPGDIAATSFSFNISKAKDLRHPRFLRRPRRVQGIQAERPPFGHRGDPGGKDRHLSHGQF